MKKVKIMLLSLALIAVVGGALAFKANLDPLNFCTAEPFEDNGDFYCTFDNNGAIPTITTDCAQVGQLSYTTNPAEPGDNAVLCVSLTDDIDACSGKKCPISLEFFIEE